jgi:hypothetical protein
MSSKLTEQKIEEMIKEILEEQKLDEVSIKVKGTTQTKLAKALGVPRGIFKNKSVEIQTLANFKKPKTHLDDPEDLDAALKTTTKTGKKKKARDLATAIRAAQGVNNPPQNQNTPTQNQNTPTPSGATTVSKSVIPLQKNNNSHQRKRHMKDVNDALKDLSKDSNIQKKVLDNIHNNLNKIVTVKDITDAIADVFGNFINENIDLDAGTTALGDLKKAEFDLDVFDTYDYSQKAGTTDVAIRTFLDFYETLSPNTKFTTLAKYHNNLIDNIETSPNTKIGAVATRIKAGFNTIGTNFINFVNTHKPKVGKTYLAKNLVLEPSFSTITQANNDKYPSTIYAQTSGVGGGFDKAELVYSSTFSGYTLSTNGNTRVLTVGDGWYFNSNPSNLMFLKAAIINFYFQEFVKNISGSTKIAYAGLGKKLKAKLAAGQVTQAAEEEFPKTVFDDLDINSILSDPTDTLHNLIKKELSKMTGNAKATAMQKQTASSLDWDKITSLTYTGLTGQNAQKQVEKVLEANQKLANSTELPSFNITVKFGEIKKTGSSLSSTVPAMFNTISKNLGSRVEDSISSICQQYNDILDTAQVQQAGGSFADSLSKLTSLQTLTNLMSSTDEASNMGFLFEGFMASIVKKGFREGGNLVLADTIAEVGGQYVYYSAKFYVGNPLRMSAGASTSADSTIKAAFGKGSGPTKDAFDASIRGTANDKNKPITVIVGIKNDPTSPTVLGFGKKTYNTVTEMLSDRGTLFFEPITGDANTSILDFRKLKTVKRVSNSYFETHAPGLNELFKSTTNGKILYTSYLLDPTKKDLGNAACQEIENAEKITSGLLSGKSISTTPTSNQIKTGKKALKGNELLLANEPLPSFDVGESWLQTKGEDKNFILKKMQEVFNSGGGNIEDALLNLVQFYQKAVGDTLAIKKVSELMSKIMFFQSLFNFVETAGPSDAGFIMENFLTRLIDGVKLGGNQELVDVKSGTTGISSKFVLAYSEPDDNDKELTFFHKLKSTAQLNADVNSVAVFAGGKIPNSSGGYKALYFTYDTYDGQDRPKVKSGIKRQRFIKEKTAKDAKIDLDPANIENYSKNIIKLANSLNLSLDEIYKNFNNFKILIMDYFLTGKVESGQAALTSLKDLYAAMQKGVNQTGLSENKLQQLDKLILEILQESLDK